MVVSTGGLDPRSGLLRFCCCTFCTLLRLGLFLPTPFARLLCHTIFLRFLPRSCSFASWTIFANPVYQTPLPYYFPALFATLLLHTIAAILFCILVPYSFAFSCETLLPDSSAAGLYSTLLLQSCAVFRVFCTLLHIFAILFATLV
jgi:hypothetical protein